MFAIFTSPYDICQDGKSRSSDILCRVPMNRYFVLTFLMLRPLTFHNYNQIVNKGKSVHSRLGTARVLKSKIGCTIN